MRQDARNEEAFKQAVYQLMDSWKIHFRLAKWFNSRIKNRDRDVRSALTPPAPKGPMAKGSPVSAGKFHAI